MILNFRAPLSVPHSIETDTWRWNLWVETNTWCDHIIGNLASFILRACGEIPDRTDPSPVTVIITEYQQKHHDRTLLPPWDSSSRPPQPPPVFAQLSGHVAVINDSLLGRAGGGSASVQISSWPPKPSGVSGCSTWIRGINWILWGYWTSGVCCTMQDKWLSEVTSGLT